MKYQPHSPYSAAKASSDHLYNQSPNTVDRLLGRTEGTNMDLITYVTDRADHDLRYAIDSTKLQRELVWESTLQFEEGIEKTVRWYLDNQKWMDNVTSGDYM